MPIVAYVNIIQEAIPVAPKHLVTLEVVESLLSGKLKVPVRLVAVNNLAGTHHGGPSHELDLTAHERLEIDGEDTHPGDRVLLVGQTQKEENGIYTVEDEGEGPGGTPRPAKLKRATDFDDSSKIQQGVQMSVLAGDNHANSTWRLITGGTIVLDSTQLEFLEVVPTTGTAKFVDEIHGDNTETDFDIDHQLGTEDVAVQVYDSNTKMMVMTDVTIEDSNTVVIGFEKAPATSDIFKVVVIG